MYPRVCVYVHGPEHVPVFLQKRGRVEENAAPCVGHNTGCDGLKLSRPRRNVRGEAEIREFLGHRGGDVRLGCGNGVRQPLALIHVHGPGPDLLMWMQLGCSFDSVRGVSCFSCPLPAARPPGCKHGIVLESEPALQGC